MTVGSIEYGVIRKLGNRGDLKIADSGGNIPLYVWIAQAVRELTDNYQFEELRVIGPTIAFTINDATYDLDDFTIGGNDTWTDIITWFLELDSSTGIGWVLEYRDPSIVVPLSKVPGPPKFWTQHGNTIIVAPKPDKAYNSYWLYQKRHPFTAVVAVGDTIYMPDSWQDIIEIAAALRGAIEKRATDYVQMYDTILNGDEEYTRSGGKKGRPGLIFGRVSQQQRNRTHNSRQLAPTVIRYGR